MSSALGSFRVTDTMGQRMEPGKASPPVLALIFLGPFEVAFVAVRTQAAGGHRLDGFA